MLLYQSMGKRCSLLFTRHKKRFRISLVTAKIITNTGKNQMFRRRFRRKESARRKCRSHLIHKVFSGNFILDSFSVFSEPMGTINIDIM